ncbi:hypothetical protein PACTADRAFT_49384 [Pachysolen tannophilus NRRL Y-2460]|uniref:Manganese resistance protein MNR2 n=1 Tax=Pachysolen tannophilus NRRL Y-2460 TaxID=669874 RepID=A0A1E4TWC0_PACTA|nr:hypothetical protein PACTADRAFT_49384 [Pachysolen tannophilus NRRL Y-2460]
MSASNNQDEEVDPLLPVNNNNDNDDKSHSNHRSNENIGDHGGDHEENVHGHSHGHRPSSNHHRVKRRASFGTSFLHSSPQHLSRRNSTLNDAKYLPLDLPSPHPKGAGVNPSYSSFRKNNNKNDAEGEVDALGILHTDFSDSSISSANIGSAVGAFIDHTNFSRAGNRNTSRFKSKSHAAGTTIVSPPALSSVSHETALPSSKTTSKTSKYIPKHATRPTFAEQWVRRQSSIDKRDFANDGDSSTPDISDNGGASLQQRESKHLKSGSSSANHGNFSAADTKPATATGVSGYGSTGQEPQNKASFEIYRHNRSPHHLRFENSFEPQFEPEYEDINPPQQDARCSSSSDEFEFSGSNPSSRGSSNASSLDDVCFPLEELDEQGHQKVWPDLKVLEEFAREELEQLEEASKINTTDYQQQQEHTGFTRKSSTSSYSGNNNIVGFQNPIVSAVDTNVLSSSKLRINETEPINGRLRPPKVVPWERKPQKQASPLPPQVLGANINNNFDYSKNLIEQFRFTYFREDLESTIHSPTISGLLQEGQSFADLFSASHYGSMSYNKQASMSASDGLEHTLTNSSSQQPPLQQNQNSKSNTPSNYKTPTPSVNIKDQDELGGVSPFWLDVLNPTEEEMKVLSKAFNIHPLTTEDIYLGETREKVELFKDYYLVCFRSFDIVHERYKQKKLIEKKLTSKEINNDISDDERDHQANKSGIKKAIRKLFFLKEKASNNNISRHSKPSSVKSSIFSDGPARKQKELIVKENKQKGGYRHKPREGELEPLNMYIIVFRDAVLTFHFAPTPHPVNVRRRARLLRDYLTVSADWIGYALIDDITDAFAPMIESIEDEVNAIEDSILKMNSHDSDDSDEEYSSDSESDDESAIEPFWYNDGANGKKTHSTSDKTSLLSKRSRRSVSSKSQASLISSTSSSSTKITGWEHKGDMLRRIGECRKRVMSILRLLGSKADVIKGFAKRCNEQWEVAPRSEIGMYLGDIQDHIVTMVQSLNHYEKLLARSHSNYLAQINIDMTRVNNDMNDVLGKITILGTVVLPMNIITGLWGMNVLVPGQDEDGLHWFFGIFACMCLLAFTCYVYAKRVSGLT